MIGVPCSHHVDLCPRGIRCSVQEGPSRHETGSLTEAMPEEEQMPVVSIPGSDLLCLWKTINDKLPSWSFDFFG